jgi:hypothetical protein
MNKTGNVRINVILKFIRVTIVATEDQKVLNIMCVGLYFCVWYPAGKSHLCCAALYCHLWPVWLYQIVPHYPINGTIFGKNVLNIKCVLFPATIFVLKIFLCKKNSQLVM